MDTDESSARYRELEQRYLKVKAERDALQNSLAIRLRDRLGRHPWVAGLFNLLWQWDRARAGTAGHGRAAGQLTAEWLLKSNVFPCPLFPIAHRNERLGTPGKPKAILVSHDARRAGAQLIALNLLREFSADSGFEFFVLFRHSDGAKSELVAEFARFAHVIRNDDQVHMVEGEWLAQAIALMHPPGVAFAITNGADSLEFIPKLKSANIPVVALVHEYLDIIQYTSRWPSYLVHRFLFAADKVIFPSAFTYTVALRAANPPQDKIAVLPQGLLDPRFGTGDRTAGRRRVRERHGIPEDAALILGCGSIDARKGADLFTMLAARLLARADGERLYFLWLGGENEYSGEIRHWINRALLVMPRSEHLILAGKHALVEDYFLAADVFALTSREDPFPCVVHEAMAAGLPVITFEGNGGAAEALEGDCGRIVPYLDVGAMADAVLDLLADPAAAAELAERARQKVRSAYDFHAYYLRLRKLMREELRLPV
jgi:glycosyltransferase involved in cell wall biosynthesis